MVYIATLSLREVQIEDLPFLQFGKTTQTVLLSPCKEDASFLAFIFFCSGTDERSRSKRMHIYVSLLKQMAPEHLLATSAKLCAEILAAVCDGLLSVDDAGGRAVLQVGINIFRTQMVLC
jgi:hypothetical protein